MATPDTLSYNEVLVLQAVSLGCRYGLEIMDRTALSAGTVYPLLRRLEAHGCLATSHEPADAARADGRPARRLVDLTREGKAALARARAELHARHAALDLLPRGRG